MTIHELRAAYLAGTTTPTVVIEEVFATIAAKDADIHAFLHIYEDARAEAVRATEAIKKDGDATPALTGIPVALKTTIS